MTIDLGPFLAFLVAAVVGLGLSLVTFYVAKKGGLAPVQTQLIETLKENALALDKRVELLEGTLEEERALVAKLTKTVARLRDALVDLADENTLLRKKLGMPARKGIRPDVGEDDADDAAI